MSLAHVEVGKSIKNVVDKDKKQVTSCIVHLADSANFEGVATNKICNGLTGSCFKSPNDTIHATVVFHAKNRKS